jgi:hypothetical protein
MPPSFLALPPRPPCISLCSSPPHRSLPRSPKKTKESSPRQRDPRAKIGIERRDILGRRHFRRRRLRMRRGPFPHCHSPFERLLLATSCEWRIGEWIPVGLCFISSCRSCHLVSLRYGREGVELSIPGRSAV